MNQVRILKALTSIIIRFQNIFHYSYKSLSKFMNFSIRYQTVHNWNATCTNQSQYHSHYKVDPCLVILHIKVSFEPASRWRIPRHPPAYKGSITSPLNPHEVQRSTIDGGIVSYLFDNQISLVALFGHNNCSKSHLL